MTADAQRVDERNMDKVVVKLSRAWSLTSPATVQGEFIGFDVDSMAW